MNGKMGYYLQYQIEPDSDKTVLVKLKPPQNTNESASLAAEAEYKKRWGKRISGDWMGYPVLVHFGPLKNL